MSGFKIKDLIKEKPSHIRNWENLKEMSLYTLKGLNDIKMRDIKGFDIKCKRMLDEATSSWISPILGIDVLIRDKIDNQFGEYKEIEVFQDKKLVHTYTKFYTSVNDMLISIEDLANEYNNYEIIYKADSIEERISKNVRLAISIIHKLTE